MFIIIILTLTVAGKNVNKFQISPKYYDNIMNNSYNHTKNPVHLI